MQKQYETLSTIVTETWFKQRVFLGFKHAVQQERIEATNNKVKSWKTWCDTSRDKKYFKKKSLLIKKIEGIRTERLIKKVFDALRYANVQRKFEETRDLLNAKEPEKKELEYRKDCLIKNT